MRSGQFNNRRPRNAVGAGKRNSGNEFNTSLKRERHPEPPQYPTSEVDERKQFSETRDARPERSENRSQSSSSRSESSSSGSRSSSSRSAKQMQNAARNVVRNTVVMVGGGATVLANTTMPQLKEAFPILDVSALADPPAIVEVVEQAPSSETDWLIEDTEPGGADDASNESLGDASDSSGMNEGGGDSGDNSGGEGGGESSGSQDSAPQDTVAPETPVEPEAPEESEEPEEPEESDEPEEPEESEEPE